MVSPPKYCSTPNRDFKVGNQRLIKDKIKSPRVSKQRRPFSYLGKYKPLSSKIFYLDVRSQAESTRLESTLKAYGAKIDVFFGKDVSYVVTDRTEWPGNGQSPAASFSPIRTPSPSSQVDQKRLLPRSRTSAMLEKVSQQPSSPNNNPLALAQKWKIHVFSISSFWMWLAKIRKSVLLKATEKKNREKESVESEIVVDASDSPFIKIESLLGLDKPELLELESWPRLYLDGLLGQCPFRSPRPPTSAHSEELEERSHSFEVKDKVKVELIKYDTDFRINTNKMTRRLMRSNMNNEDESVNNAIKQNVSNLCNGHTDRTITRQTSQELLKVQCNGLTTSHRNSKLLSPSGSDVLPLPTSRRSTRRASASWCGSTRELAQLSPTDGDIENIRRSESSFETNDTSLDSPGITLRPKGQLWLPVALIGTTAEENGNSIRRRFEYSAKQSENAKFCNFIIDSLNSKSRHNSLSQQSLSRASKGSDSSLNSNCSDQNEYHIKRNNDRRDTYCIITRNTKVKSDEMNGKSRESSVESHNSVQDAPKSRIDGKKRSLSVGGSATSVTKRCRTVSTNSACSVVRKKKLSPEEKLLQDNKDYFKMEVLNVKLRSSGSLLNTNQNKDAGLNGGAEKPVEKIEKIIIKKIKVRGKKKKSSWTKTIEKKSDSDYAAVTQDGKDNNKPDIRLNGIIRKKRQSELTKLCDEAESFMFGESSRQGNPPATCGAQSTTGENSQDDKKKSANLEVIEDNSGNSASEPSENDNRRRKKRRSHAEAFIHDNLDYYKFETPGSRLRYQGSFIDSKQENNDFVFTLKDRRTGKSPMEEKSDSIGKMIPESEIKTEPELKVEKKKNPVQPSEEIEKLLFSFESIPVMEPWYDVYKRQDEGMENYYPLLSDPSNQPFFLPYEMPKTFLSRVPEMSDYYKKKKKKLPHLFNHPRKSPRCHASTLAILSSLKKRKRRSGTNISMNSVLSESPQANSSSAEERTEMKHQESEEVSREAMESNDLLNFLQEDDPSEDRELIFLEPLSDSESSSKCKSSENNKSDNCTKSEEEEEKEEEEEEEEKLIRTGNRARKTRSESQSDVESVFDEGKQFCLRSIESGSFFEDMVIETRKRSGLNVSVAAVLENFRNYKTDDGEVDLISEFGGSSIADGQDLRRKKKKARKINKTGWDNKKSRRRIGNKVTESKVISDSDSVVNKPKKIKTKVKLKEYGIDEDNIIVSSKRRLRNNDEDKRPMLRSRVEVDRFVALRRSSQESETHSENMEPNTAESPPSNVHAKASESRQTSGVRIRCANGRYGIKNKLGLSKKRRVIDYAWTTKRR